MTDRPDPPTSEEPGQARLRPDTCPGTLALHSAQDGALARIRIPGGMLTAQALTVLADAAAELGDGRLELTSRGNIQIRGMDGARGPDLTERIKAAGLLPSPAHERVRNILASPLSGLDDAGSTDVTELVGGLDRELCARPHLAQLPGRFLFAIDDGRGDLYGCGADVRITATGDDKAHVWPGDLVVDLRDAVATAVVVAEAFVDEQQAQSSAPEHAAWRVRELTGGAGRVARRALAGLAALGIQLVTASLAAAPDRAPHPVGVGAQRDGLHCLTVLAPLGRLGTAQAHILAGLAGPRGVRTTPWRSVVVTDLADPRHAVDTATAAGFGVSGDSPWFNVTSCAGRPGCAKALADVQADARAVAAASTVDRGRLAVHWSGCERRCGRPAGTVVDVLATSTGYLVSDASGRIHRVADPTGPVATVEVLRRG
jgi:precorrin-3B synthase